MSNSMLYPPLGISGVQYRDADLALDHFHRATWFHEKQSLLQRQLYNQATQAEQAVLEGSRWLTPIIF